LEKKRKMWKIADASRAKGNGKRENTRKNVWETAEKKPSN